MPYAKGTKVDAGRTQQQIEKFLHDHGASNYHYGIDYDEGKAGIAFKLSGLSIHIVIPIPSEEDDRFLYTDSRQWMRSDTARTKLYDAEIRRRFRVLLEVIRAKIIAVEDGISTIEEEFLSDVVTPSGETVGERMSLYMRQLVEGTAPALQLPPGQA